MISEKEIDQIAEALSQKDFDDEWISFSKSNPNLYGYLLNDQLDILSDEEFKLFWFGAMVIIRAFENRGVFLSGDFQAQLEKLESLNWSMLENTGAGPFSEKLDVFFRETTQEDLLAFIEDLLAEDDDMQVSSAAREIIFVNLKSIVDLLEEVENAPGNR